MVERVPLAHVALALLVTVIWGVAFVATRLALDDFSPPALTALRFLVAALPAALLPRPRVSWRALVLVGLTLYTGQFLFQFFGIAAGMPPGPLPGLALAILWDGPRALWDSWLGASWLALGAILYLGVVATVLAYAIWGYLLRRHPAAQVAPFALLIPFVAAASSALVLGERFGPRRLVGIGLVLLGLVIIVRPGGAGVTEPPPRSR